MIVNNYPVSFEAQLSAVSLRKLKANRPHSIQKLIDWRCADMYNWGSNDAVIILDQPQKNERGRFLLINSRITNKKAIISKEFTTYDVLDSFFGIKRGIIEKTEDLMKKFYTR